jgi:D-alanyl-lipoteichoic acid acyltransferase DltB (MBOAT superfamily)
MAFVPKYILILLALIVIDFFMAQMIEKSEGRKRKIFFICSLISNIGILFVFKYFNFFNENIGELAKILGWNYSIKSLSLILPLGLSFHTFQSLSYVIEVYRGKYKAEKHFGIYALYVLFFPQLVAGPIERPQHLLPQLKKDINFDFQNIILGIRLMTWGFFKKLVVADRLAIAVTYVYSHLSQSTGPGTFTAMIFFAFQLYADFSGYSDIARGSAKTLGIDVVKNFNQPYFSTSIAEFWRKWHISLSNWFRDYFYFPVAFSKKNNSRYWLYFSIFLTFLVTGLWHGAGWTFVVMGALHGLYIVSGQVFKPFRDKIANTIYIGSLGQFRANIQKIITFLLVSFSWIFFRSPNMTTAMNFVKSLFSNWSLNLGALQQALRYPFDTLGFSKSDLILSVGGILVILIIEHIQNKEPIDEAFSRQSVLTKTFLYSSLVMAIFLFGVYSSEQFIYFQF